MKLYKGYVRSNNKKPIEKFTTGKLHTYEEVKNSYEFMGVLADDVILIDFDDEEHAKRALELVEMYEIKTKAIKTTRGIHFLFKINDHFQNACTHRQLTSGLIADIKLGKKNGLQVLKFGGKEREVLYETDEIEEPPIWLYPLATTEQEELLGLVEGEGRNDKLYKYIIKLMKVLEKDEAKEMVEFINDHIFGEGLPAAELKNLLDDRAYDNVEKKPKKSKKINNEDEEDVFIFDGKVNIEKFAKFLIKNENIVKIDNQLYTFNGKYYENGNVIIERNIIKHLPNTKDTTRKEITKYINLLIEENKTTEPYNYYIVFRNGVYDIIQDELKPFSAEYIITNYIDWDYKVDAYSEIVDNFLNSIICNDANLRKILEEMVGYTFFRQNELGKSFILLGNKSNGKSTWQAILQKLLGSKNLSSIDMKDLGERFKTAELYNKLANIGDDICDNYIDDNNMFKSIVTGGRIIAERKGQDPFEFQPYCKLIYSSNNMPKTRDRTGAVKRRLIIIPFNREFKPTDADFDPYIKYKLTIDNVELNMSYLINLGLKGLQRILQNNGFTKSELVEKQIEEYDKDNNPYKRWIEDIGDIQNFVEDEAVSVVYNSYQDYCKDSGIKPISKNELSKNICKEYGFETVTKWCKKANTTTRTFQKCQL